MMVASQFEHKVDPKLVYLFFSTFARFEYALKETGQFCRRGRTGAAEPDWESFARSIAAQLESLPDPATKSAIAFLLANPPATQMYVAGRPVFQDVPLRANSASEQAIEAVKRVRNNLFHGGKHSPHSPPGRDQALIESSLAVLEASLLLSAVVRGEFEATSP